MEKKGREGESERAHPLKMFQVLVLVMKTLCIYNMVNMKNKENYMIINQEKVKYRP